MKHQETASQLAIEGNFNTLLITQHDLYGPSLLRLPHLNRDLLKNIQDEYRAIGFTGRGGRIRRRTLREQFDFSRIAAQKGLRVLPPLEFTGYAILYPFLEDAQRLDQYLQENPADIPKTLVQIITDLKTAHENGFIYGDRWAGNMLVSQPYGLLHIDFDIEITGPPAIELEVAQSAYHSLWAAGDTALPILADLLGRESEDWFDIELISQFMRGLAQFLNETRVGGMQDQTEALIQALHLSQEKYTI